MLWLPNQNEFQKVDEVDIIVEFGHLSFGDEFLLISSNMQKENGPH
jgi:hypothetical protein